MTSLTNPARDTFIRLTAQLNTTRGFEALDLRDRVYALIGFTGIANVSTMGHETLLLKPDYAKSSAQVYRDLTRSIVIATKDLTVLLHVKHDLFPRTETESWVSRWDERKIA